VPGIGSDLKKGRSDLKKRREIGMLCDLRKVKVEIFERKKSDMQERGKICKLCALIKVRIVKIS
jgi:hypothetical protein